MTRSFPSPLVYAARSLPRLVATALVAAALLVAARPAPAADPEAVCLKGRYDAAAKHSACQQKVMAKYFGGASLDDTLQAAFSKCRAKYTATWAKLRARASGTGVHCDNDRYDTDTSGIVIDRLTGLQWEQKTDDGTVHDKDNQYTWGNQSVANGPVFTSFLATLNGGGCFAEHCDWRLPTVYELQTILQEPFPCPAAPCIDEVVFGPTWAFYWSAMPIAGNPAITWSVNFFNGGRVSFDATNATYLARAVRGGL